MLLRPVLAALALLPTNAAAQIGYEHRVFVEAGFVPIEQATAAGREVRRLRLFDPYMILPVPALELERHRDGRVTLTAQYRGYVGALVTVAPAAWDWFARMEAATFAPPAPAPPQPRAKPGDPPPSPPPICHAWSAFIEADAQRVASWSGCSDQRPAVRDYVLSLLSLALTSRPACDTAANDRFWSFNNCYTAPATLDDPTLEARRAPLVKTYDAIDGATPLGEARRALAAPEATRATAAPLVARFRELQGRRHALIAQLAALTASAGGAAPADKVRLEQRLESWRRFTASQDDNLAQLERALARLPAGA